MERACNSPAFTHVPGRLPFGGGQYVEHYQRERPHRGLALATPIGPKGEAGRVFHVVDVRRRDLLGGLIHEYSSPAA